MLTIFSLFSSSSSRRTASHCKRIVFHDQGCVDEYIMKRERDIQDHVQLFPVGVLQRKIGDGLKIDKKLTPRFNSNYTFVVHAAGLAGKEKVLRKALAPILGSGSLALNASLGRGS